MDDPVLPCRACLSSFPHQTFSRHQSRDVQVLRAYIHYDSMGCEHGWWESCFLDAPPLSGIETVCIFPVLGGLEGGMDTLLVSVW